jgi:hypothetical protein
MIENYRTGLLWKYFMQSPEIKPALDAIGFTADVVSTKSIADNILSIKYYPNPGFRKGLLELDLNSINTLNINLYDAQGKLIEQVIENKFFTTGKHTIEINLSFLNKGIYFIRVEGLQVDEKVKVMIQ